MKSRILSLIFILGLMIAGTGIQADEKAQVPATGAMTTQKKMEKLGISPQTILSGLCTVITSLAGVPAGCTEVCSEISNPTFNAWQAVTCCVHTMQNKVGTMENMAVMAFCDNYCGASVCGCAKSPCDDGPYWSTNVCGSLCCNNPKWMSDNVTACLSSYKPGTTTCSSYPVGACPTQFTKQTPIPQKQ